MKEIGINQVWKHNDNHSKRYVRIVTVGTGVIETRTCTKDGQDIKGMPITQSKRARFRGLSGGFSYYGEVV